VIQRLRAPLAAGLALLIGGDLAVRGPAALLDGWRFLFPYLWLFLAFEALNRRRRLGDAEAFLIGAAVGLVHDGMLVKQLQDGVRMLGVDWLAAAVAVFDWGMITVVALHAADAILPRPEGEDAPEGLPEKAVLAAVAAGALAVYLYDGWTGSVRVERMLGDAWLSADLLFAGAAALLVRRALARAAAEEPPERDAWLWWLGGFCAWLPGAQFLARLAGDWPGPLSILLVGGWAAAVAALARILWRERGHVDLAPRRASRPILALAAWRLLGAVLLLLTLGPFTVDARTALVYLYIVGLPTRLAFCAVFFSSRLKV
jgi:hypothetical protein